MRSESDVDVVFEDMKKEIEKLHSDKINLTQRLEVIEHRRDRWRNIAETNADLMRKVQEKYLYLHSETWKHFTRSLPSGKGKSTEERLQELEARLQEVVEMLSYMLIEVSKNADKNGDNDN